MSSIVLSIQKDILDSEKRVSDILRQAYILSRKLKITDFEKWITNELNGYKARSEIPDYRYIKSTIKGWNPYNGWIPVIIQDQKMANQLTNTFIGQSIPELEDLVKNSKGILHQELPDSFGGLTGHYTRYIAEISSNSIQGIIEKVKNIIMEWILKIEEDGIKGEDMSFTEEEKNIAERQQYTVNNFYGDITGSQIQQNSSQSTQTIKNENINDALLKEIISLLTTNKSDLCDKTINPEVFNEEIENLQNESAKERPSKVILNQSLQTIRSLLEGIAGNIIAAGLLYKIGLFI